MWSKWVAFAVAEGFTAIVLLLIVLDIWLTWTRSVPVGRYAWRWLKIHPWLNLCFGVVAGAMVGHFFAKG